jgi:hypothetical protein
MSEIEKYSFGDLLYSYIIFVQNIKMEKEFLDLYEDSINTKYESEHEDLFKEWLEAFPDGKMNLSFLKELKQKMPANNVQDSHHLVILNRLKEISMQ